MNIIYRCMCSTTLYVSHDYIGVLGEHERVLYTAIMYSVAEKCGRLVPFNDSAEYETTRTRLLHTLV